MQATYASVNEILATLPIGYYLGSNIPIHLDPFDNKTYFNPIKYEIVISYQMIVETLKKLPDSDDPETIIRSLLYHELSHVLLTPQTLADTAQNAISRTLYIKWNYDLSKIWNIINIFEDERIESYLRKFYLNVDFHKLVGIINAPETGMKMWRSGDPMWMFYAVVRFKTGKKYFVDKANFLLKRWLSKTAQMNRAEKYDYCKEVFTLFDELFDFVNQQQQEQSDNAQTRSNDSPQSQQQSDDNASNNQEAPQETHEQDDGKSDSSEASGEISSEDDIVEGDHMTVEDLLKTFNLTPEDSATIVKNVRQYVQKLFVNPKFAEIESRVTRILTNKLKRQMQQSGEHVAYAGRIDPRKCGNKDYRWFTRPSADGSGKKYGKIKFNLFTDDSGSFDGSMNTVNALFGSLMAVEQKFPQFRFDVIRLGASSGEHVCEKTERFVTCEHGSDLYQSIFQTYKKLQDPQAINVNIVCMDGWFCATSEPRHSFAAFNHPNVYMVVDSQNQTNVKHCPQAKITLLKSDYAERFIDAVLTHLERALI